MNWPLIVILCAGSFPGIFLAMPQLIHFLLRENTENLQRKITRIANLQTMTMVLLMSIAGNVISGITGLNAPILQLILTGDAAIGYLLDFLFPVFLYTVAGLIFFLILYYGAVASILDESTFKVMNRLRKVIGLAGGTLYGGITEEILARWGLLNVITFFSILISGKHTNLVYCLAIFISGFFYSLCQLPAYLAAGCKGSRRFIYSLVLLYLVQSILFGLLFWRYGIEAAILSHILFYIGWWTYDHQ